MKSRQAPCGTLLTVGTMWDSPHGREQFHGLGSMYCRGAAAVILTYDVTSWQSLKELEERFLSLTDTANHDCIYAIVGNKADLTDPRAQLLPADPAQSPAEVPSACPTPPASPLSPPPGSPATQQQVGREEAAALYGRVLRYKGLDEGGSLPADRMCFETSARTGYNVDLLFETLFDLVLPSILRKRTEHRRSPTVDLEDCCEPPGRRRGGCC
ncbi:unnamed protein product [Boreogadus saida]